MESVNNSTLSTILSLFLPRVISEHFTLTGLETSDVELILHFEENNQILEPIANHTYKPNGFYPESTIQDFPIRDKKTLIVIKRRRWIDNSTGESYHNRYDITADGTRYSKEFAAFLKCTLGNDADFFPLA